MKFIPLSRNLYSLPKTHKLNVQRNNLSLCPIMSSIGTYIYHLSKFFTDLLDPIIPTSHCTKDSFTFCEEIKNVSVTNRFLICYDTCSLFTSIPYNETVDIAVNLLFEHNPGLNITKAESKKLVQFSFSRYILRPNRWCCHGLLVLSWLIFLWVIMKLYD